MIRDDLLNINDGTWSYLRKTQKTAIFNDNTIREIGGVSIWKWKMWRENRNGTNLSRIFTYSLYII